MGQLEDMAMFVRIVEAGGISKAAEQLDIAKSAVSRRLNELEGRLGSQLISRTTRKSKLTEAGEHFYQRALNILDEVDTLNEQTSGVRAEIEGTLKMSAPLSFGLMHLSCLIDEYGCEHPNLSFQLDFSDRQVDLVEEGYELAIRIGELPDSTMQAKRLTRIRQVLCASPDYLEKAGTPVVPEDLNQHQFLQYGFGKHGHIEFSDRQGQKQSLEVESRMKANNGDFLLQMAINGHGIACLPTFLAYNALREGQLVALLPGCRLPDMNAYAVYPQNRFLSQRCRRLIDFISERFGEDPYWDQAIALLLK